MKIGLTYTGTEEKHQNYVRWLLGYDPDPDIEVIRLSAGDKNLQMVKDCDALVFSGGVDIHPKFYKGEMEFPNAQQFNEERDQFEMDAFQLSQKENKPVLAICRGMQLVNVIHGGSLKQDLGAANTIHRFENSDKSHGVNIEKGTLLHQLAGVERGVANSAHHQAIDSLGAGLKINCYSDDGVAEGAEWQVPDGKPFLLCVQWHPERMDQLRLQQSPLSKTIRDRFIEEVKRSMEKK